MISELTPQENCDYIRETERWGDAGGEAEQRRATTGGTPRSLSVTWRSGHPGEGG